MAACIDDIVLLASGARSAAPTIPDQNNSDVHDGVVVTLDLTAFVTAASLTLNIQKFIPGKGFVTVLSSAVIAANGTTHLRMFPGAAEITNASRNDFLSKEWRVTVTHGNGNSHTYSVTASRIRLGR